MTKNMPLISVVMTSYNHEKYLASAIESVQNQTFSDFELIIIDDHSVDGSQEIIRRYQEKDPRIRFIFHDRNQGISRTTNDGFAAATGDFVAYMQSDDLWLSAKLEKQMQILKEDPNLIVWSDASIINEFGEKTGQLFTEKYNAIHKIKSGNLFDNLVNTNYICGQSMVLKRSIVKRFQFDPRLVYANDYKFMIEVSREHEFCFIEEPLTQYRIHATNSIHGNGPVWDRDMFMIRKFILQKYGESISSTAQGKLYDRIGKYLSERNHAYLAKKFIGASICHNPLKTSYYKKYVKAYFKTARGIKNGER